MNFRSNKPPLFRYFPIIFQLRQDHDESRRNRFSHFRRRYAFYSLLNNGFYSGKQTKFGESTPAVAVSTWSDQVQFAGKVQIAISFAIHIRKFKPDGQARGNANRLMPSKSDFVTTLKHGFKTPAAFPLTFDRPKAAQGERRSGWLEGVTSGLALS